MRLGILALNAALVGTLACQSEFEERVDATPGGHLELDLDFGEGLRPDPGSLEIVSRSADEVSLVGEATGWGADAVRFRVVREGDTVRIDGGVGGPFSWLFGGPKVRVRVGVPRHFSADLRSNSAPIRIEDLRGELRVRSEDGAVEVSGVEGPVRLRLGSGGVRVSEVVGDVDVRLGDGDIELSWVRGDADVRTGDGALEVTHLEGQLRARTDSGSIELRDVAGAVEAKTERGSVYASFGPEPEGLLETRRGSVEVRIPADASADLDATSTRGRVELAAGLAAPGQVQPDRAVLALNGGGAPLQLFTARGDILVRTQ